MGLLGRLRRKPTWRGPVFVGGTGRSGTTVVGQMLGEHPEYAAVPVEVRFHTEAGGVKDTWPASGPRVMWKRSLGEGYSSTVVEDDVLYTMYGKARQEVVLAANAETGAPIWEQTTPVNFQSDYPEMGNGPYATPLIVGNRLFTAGVAGLFQCLDKKTGKVVWSQQLWTDHNGSRLMYGYASSPVAFRDLAIVPVGGRGRSVMAFHQADGLDLAVVLMNCCVRIPAHRIVEEEADVAERASRRVD
jgi:outer membrane protein assembly factor BamB